mgnify:CR=1 FL=1
MSESTIMLTLARVEAHALADLVAQFTSLVSESSAADDEAVARLTPSAYPDDADASEEFRRATADDLLARREADGLRVLADLAPSFAHETQSGAPDEDLIDIALDSEGGWAWMRTLAAVRLVIASRLGIAEDTSGTHEQDARRFDDDRFAVYDWVGYRLDGLVQALDAAPSNTD